MKRSGSDHRNPPIFGIYKYIIIVLGFILIINYIYHNTSLFYRKSLVLPFSLHLNSTDVYLLKGEEFYLYVVGINKRVTFSSTNFRVAGVNFTGRIHGYQTGKTFIIAKVDKKELRCRVHVIDINDRSRSLSVGESCKLRIRGSNAFVSWSSTNEKVASVSIFGKVTAKSKGTATICAKVKGKRILCEIRVE